MTKDQIMKLVDAYATQMTHSHYHPLMEARAAVVAALEGVSSVHTQEPVAWFEHNASLDAWFLSYGFNPKAKTRPLYEHPAPQPAEPLTGKELTKQASAALAAASTRSYEIAKQVIEARTANAKRRPA